MEPRRILIVANQTAGGEHLRQEVKSRLDDGPCSFTLLVPATPPQQHLTYTEGEATALAQERMETAVSGLRELGAEAEGRVGDADPIEAIKTELVANVYDEVILSTLPAGASRWLKQDLPHRVERHFPVPVTHVVAVE